MTEKITALVFGLLALGLEVWQSIVNPSVESIVAAGVALIIVVCAVISLTKRVVLTEDAPKGSRANDRVLKLANEIAPFVKSTKDGKIRLTIEKL